MFEEIIDGVIVFIGEPCLVPPIAILLLDDVANSANLSIDPETTAAAAIAVTDTDTVIRFIIN